MTVREAAERLHMHCMSVYKLVQTGRLPAVKLGHRWKIDPQRLDEWLGAEQPARRTWLLVGATAAVAERLSAAAGDRHEVRTADYGHLAEALAGEPDLVLLDTAADRHAALAALEICRASRAAPAVLLVDDDRLELVAQALAGGLVTAMPRRFDRTAVTWIETLEQ